MQEWFDNKSIAVVGNSLSLFNHRYGSSIDEHDVVIRMNRAAMLYTKFDALETHGRKTTVWGLWDSKTFSKEIKTIKESKPNLKTIHLGPAPPVDVDFVISKEWIAELKKVKIKFPSAGITILHMLTKYNPSQVDVYGFDWKETVTFTDKTKRDGHHTFDLEKKYCMDIIFTRPNYKHVKMRV